MENTDNALKIINELPRILQEHPELRIKIYEILSQNYPTREELYEYMKKSDERFNQLLSRMDRRFEEINERFEAIDRRFEAIDRRFEAIDRRFEAIDRRFEELIKEMNNRFMSIEDWVGIVVGGFQRRAGRSLEDAVAGTLRVALRRWDVFAQNIVLRKKIVDDEGLIGSKGRKYEIDLYITDSEALVFEIKSACDIEDVERFNDKALLVKKKLKIKKISKVIVTLSKTPMLERSCKKLGIILA